METPDFTYSSSDASEESNSVTIVSSLVISQTTCGLLVFSLSVVNIATTLSDDSNKAY